MAYVVEQANLDEQPVVIVGEYLTVSAVSSWVIQQDDGDAVTVKLGRIDPSETRGLAVGERIRVEAILKTEITPGGNTKQPTRRSLSEDSTSQNRVSVRCTTDLA
ncbi:hypothetical protein VST63_14800 [Mycolicibacterium sp. 050232]|uniref:hypothetical protein n=1 Tax=Mycolicibacterium sp. 050232 TaxID=3113982 RepID=UPI002E2976D2|nr:hypothetical protein [Mycolicibacterium sp. 050232]MED5813626.1 hypothetical protein [Mycolicibacterium sp. 050232]